jgi:hypothetical protein
MSMQDLSRTSAHHSFRRSAGSYRLIYRVLYLSISGNETLIAVHMYVAHEEHSLCFDISSASNRRFISGGFIQYISDHESS